MVHRAGRHRRVAVQVHDFRDFSRTSAWLEEHQIPFSVVEAAPSPFANLILDGPADDPRSVPSNRPLEELLLRCRFAMADLDPKIVQAYLGVDPGKTIGLAAVVGSVVLRTTRARSHEAALDTIACWSRVSRSCRVCLGDGAPEVRDLLLQQIQTRGHPVQLVDERRTSRSITWLSSKHESAAARIAVRGGALWHGKDD